MLKGFITNLGKYNEGKLIGKWIEFPIDEDELKKVYQEIGINEEYEEIFFTDWECELDTELGEYEGIEELNQLAEELERLEQWDEIDKLKAIIEATRYSLREAIDCVDDAVFYSGYTLDELAEEYVNDCISTKDTPDVLARYFDYEAFARDLRFDGYTETDYGVIFIG